MDSRSPQCRVKEAGRIGGWMVVQEGCGGKVRGTRRVVVLVVVCEYKGFINHVINVVHRESGGGVNRNVISGRRVVLVMVWGR